MTELYRLAAVVVLAGCGQASPPLPQPPNPSAYWIERSDAELDAVLGETCERAVSAGKPVLVAFSAPWCIDCRQMRALEAQAVLRDELDSWEVVVVHVGRFDRHPQLMDAFDVGAIAHWAALRPVDCTSKVVSWPVLRASTFEPSTGWFGVKTAEGLRDWLVEARGR